MRLKKSKKESIKGGYRPIAVGIISNINGDVLLVKKPHWKWWGFPKGGIEPGENPTQTLRRELEEELGTNKFNNFKQTRVTNKRLFSPETFKNYPDRGNIGELQYYLMASFIGVDSEIKISSELSDWKWVNKEEVVDLIYKEDRQTVKKVFV